ncbi:ESPL1 protein, partial [Rynchops niger]|nr:ESPL1 protein [Rynchops niger]
KVQLWLSGVTVCILTLAGVQPGSAGDTLLLTRLEKDAAPLSIRIPTALGKVRAGGGRGVAPLLPPAFGARVTALFLLQVPLRSVLSDFEAILKEQKEANGCTDKQDWWLRRSQLDHRMKSLIETLETQVLGCWRGALLPAPPQPALDEEVTLLHPQLGRCGWSHP